MHPPPPNSTPPVRYARGVEVPEKGETETRDALVASLHSICETTFKHAGHGVRSAHSKCHGRPRAELVVADDVAPTLATGIFAKPGRWRVPMRLSTIPGHILDDSASTPRGLTLKVVGVGGEHLAGSHGAVTHDCVLANSALFPSPDAKTVLSSLKLLAATTDKLPNFKNALSAVPRGTERVVVAFGGESATLNGPGGQPKTHIPGETFFSQAPLLYGPSMAKLSVAPVSVELAALKNAPLHVNGKPNGLRDAVLDFFDHPGAAWALRVQRCTDLENMPIEDASACWPADRRPCASVARTVAAPQPGWSKVRSAATDDGMPFKPWHGVSAHRPIGSVRRVRKVACDLSARFRAHHKCPRVTAPAGPAGPPGPADWPACVPAKTPAKASR